MAKKVISKRSRGRKPGKWNIHRDEFRAWRERHKMSRSSAGKNLTGWLRENHSDSQAAEVLRRYNQL